MHVTPHELKGLQALALAHGGSLTINPETGLPEAGFLGKVFKKLLPTLIGVGMNFVLPGSGIVAQLGGKAATAGLMTGLGSLALTGSLKKGLMAGMQAFGGASLAGGVQGAIKGAAAPVQSSVAAGSLANVPSYGSLVMPTVPGSAAGAVAKTGLGGFAQGFANTAKGTMGGLLGKAAVPMAISGALQGVSGAMSPSGGSATPTGQIDNSYQGPYYTQDRQQITDPEGPLSSKQRRHFAVSMPEVYNTAGQLVQPGSMTAQGTPVLQPVARPKAKKGENMYDFQYVPYMGGPAPTPNQQDMGYNVGGSVSLRPGSFVADARTVSEAGNGSSNAGIEALSKLGGHPVRGPGDGVSDSVRANIGGTQEARVARDEVIFPPEAVRRLGGGSEKRGTQKLYALMDKAHKARKNAKRGQDTGLRRELAV
jgi:hypothetical protein